ncbi:MAG: hypothetical protein U9R25_02845 [Chloroflexota bacterium]|nr:hypothetical protein [Chloroflexota bacterium]
MSTLIVKVGGSQGVDLEAVCDDVADLVAAGRAAHHLPGGLLQRPVKSASGQIGRRGAGRPGSGIPVQLGR